MALEQVATIAEIMASIAVVITLVFVGLQVKHNSHVNRLSASLAGAQLLSQNLGRVMENPDLAALLIGRTAGEEQTPVDHLRLSNFLSISMRHFEILHAHRRYGIHEEELWQGTEARLRGSLDNPIVQAWWKDNKNFYATSFGEFVDGIIGGMKNETGNVPVLGSDTLDKST
ncbi:MAG: hypothetical protein V3V03_09690 [Hyphomonadaceae bacterium]